MYLNPCFELDPKTYYKLTITNAVVSLPEALLKTGNLSAQGVMMTFEGTTGKNARYKKDGGDPTTTDGHQVLPGDVLVEGGRTALSQMKFIRESDTDVVAHCTGYF